MISLLALLVLALAVALFAATDLPHPSSRRAARGNTSVARRDAVVPVRDDDAAPVACQA